MTLTEIAATLEVLIEEELDYAVDSSLVISVHKVGASLEDTHKVLTKFKTLGKIREFERLQQDDTWQTTHWHIEVTKNEFHETKAAKNLTFDDRTGIMECQGKKTRIKPGTIMFSVCKKIYEHPLGTNVPEIEFERDGRRSVYDAVQGINKRASERLGIPKLLTYERCHVRVNV